MKEVTMRIVKAATLAVNRNTEYYSVLYILPT